MQASEVNPQQAFAVYFLGNKEKAFKLFDELIKKNTNNANAFYNRAGLYSLDKNKTAAIADLKTALEKGLRDFTRIMYDENMDIIRNEPEFISLIQQYKK